MNLKCFDLPLLVALKWLLISFMYHVSIRLLHLNGFAYFGYLACYFQAVMPHV